MAFHRTGESVSGFSQKSKRMREVSEQMEGNLIYTSCSPQSASACSLKQSDCSSYERERMHFVPAWTNHPFTHWQSMLLHWPEPEVRKKVKLLIHHVSSNIPHKSIRVEALEFKDHLLNQVLTSTLTKNSSRWFFLGQKYMCARASFSFQHSHCLKLFHVCLSNHWCGTAPRVFCHVALVPKLLQAFAVSNDFPAVRQLNPGLGT